MIGRDDHYPIIRNVIAVSQAFMDAHRRELEASGAKGRAAAHWLYDLGWTFKPGVLGKWLEGDRP